MKLLNLKANLIDSEISSEIFLESGLENLIELDLSFNKIAVPFNKNNPFYLKKLQKLNLSNNKINNLGSDSIFSNEFLKDLLILNLEKNSIKILYDNNNCKLSNLTELLISNNDIGYNSIKFFEGSFKNLRELIMRNNSITEPISSSIFNLESLKKLDLSRNSISNLGAKNLIKIISNYQIFELNLSMNNIYSLFETQQTPSTNKYLRNLDLSFNKINCETSQKIFKFFTGLTTIKLTSNKIKIPMLENNNPNIEKICLAANDISCIGSQFFFKCENLTRLKDLDLFDNLIEIPIDSKINLPSLITLDLSSNSINSQGSASIFTSELPLIKNLKLTQNKIEIPFLKTNIENLENLNLNNNCINSEGSEILFSEKKLKNLKNLYLENNFIAQPILSATKCFLINLEKLSLNSNEITSTGSQILFSSINLKKLIHLSMKDNKIEIPLDFNEVLINNLETLDLSKNFIKSKGSNAIFKAQNLHKLETLKITENLIEEPIDLDSENFSIQLIKIRILIMYGNQISSEGSMKLFEHNFPNLEFLDLSYNKIEVPLKKFNVGIENLIELHLNKNLINDRGLAEVIGCENLEKLVLLNLAENKIENFYLEEFKLKNLATLDLLNNESLEYKSKDILDSLSKLLNIYK